MRIKEGTIIKYSYKYGKEDGDFFVYDSLNNLLIKGKLKDNILVDTSCHYYKNKKVKTRVIYKSSNFTHHDSIRLGLLEAEGILGIFKDYMGDKGIMLKISEFDSKGRLIKEEVFDELK
jgi:antitoxin component YwqK of YwqJK toxin-antitoxin module